VELEREILRLRLETLSQADSWIHFEESLQGRDLAKLSATLAHDKELFLLLSGNDEAGYSYILTAKTVDTREIAKAMNAALDGKGGGKPEVVRGGVKATREEIERWVQEHGDLFH
jgi:alanyl-tRNA synthetase